MTIPSLPKATLSETQTEWSYIKSIESDTSTTESGEVEVVALKFKDGYITGEDFEKQFTGSLLGFQHAKWLQEHPEGLDKDLYYLFPGTVLVDVRGDRRVPCLVWRGGRWYLDWHWIGRGVGRDCWFLRLSSSGSGTLEPSDKESGMLGTSDALTRIAVALESIADYLKRECELTPPTTTP